MGFVSNKLKYLFKNDIQVICSDFNVECLRVRIKPRNDELFAKKINKLYLLVINKCYLLLDYSLELSVTNAQPNGKAENDLVETNKLSRLQKILLMEWILFPNH